jgi:formylglycine-generating enzyme required for sulfatase activity
MLHLPRLSKLPYTLLLLSAMVACGGAGQPQATVTLVPATPVVMPTVGAITPVTTNAGWTPRYATINTIEMVLVPPGCFIMGTENGDADERPTARQCFEQPFWLDRFEVTDDQFTLLGGRTSYPGNRWPGENMPRVNVTWFEAHAFCLQRGSRLPTEVEWEYAARGPDGWLYSWGNDWNIAFVSSVGDTGPRSVGSVANITSWVGAADMTGNVWEWTSSLYRPLPYVATDGREDTAHPGPRVQRGGAYATRIDYSGRTVRRKEQRPLGTFYDGGFRCARNA